ncbi:involucrin repeat protein [Niveomyces insectorum RCEF 264]|uniref:Involucrin repeat protein n=1 Tax=Niveomyces insectorum RCEF 264 TaxID=1081102 RepID=A0A162MUG7_9HYPO|nr:involucrin repeat protein [Niveomyces insectorum RCEF 264]
MNGLATRKAYGFEPEASAPLQDVMPTGRAMVNGYRQEVIDGFEPERPRYNPLNADRPQSSPLVDLKDPIQVHLLTETALSDSREWVILSQEEVDDLKKQCQSLAQRIEQTRANLAIQSKYRDAAISMAKLYSPGKRRSILSNRNSGGAGDAGREAEAERLACERRCEELASELFMLEKRMMEPQRRLFQHTAGILQLTHKGSSRNKAAGQTAANGQLINGIPGSPESMYTSSNGRDSLEIVPGGNGLFDDRSLYLPVDQLDQSAARSKANTIEIPQKSPVRKETRELREESDRLRDTNMRLQLECDQLRAAHDSISLELAALQRESSERLESVADAERQLEDSNNRLREIIIRFNPAKNGAYEAPPVGGGSEPGDELATQIKYLADGVATAQQEQELAAASVAKQADLGAALIQYEKRTAAVNDLVQRILTPFEGTSLPPIPSVTGVGSGMGLNAQLSWLEDAFPVIEPEVTRAIEASSASATDRQAVQQVDAILMGLWDIIRSGFAELQRKQEERKASRAQMGLSTDDEDDEDDLLGDGSPIRADEPYSQQAFSTTVQWLYTQTTKLREQKSVLQRQIKQQRELNSKSDAERDRELQDKASELDSVAAALQNKTVELQQARKVAEETQDKLAHALLDLSEAQQNYANKDNEASAAVKSAEKQLAERTAQLSALQSRSSELQAALTTSEASIADLTARLKQASDAQEAATANAEQAAKDVQTKDQELERLNAMVVELKTEATIAKAELDGAYGSRAQRAADVAALAKSSEQSELQIQFDNMKKELASTLKEYEDLTKDTIAAEREKLDLESQLDDAQAAKTALETEMRATCTKLEAEIAALKEELDAEKLKVAPTSGGGTTRAGASMLSEQFRATMKEERKKFQEEMRNEQMQRRKLEEEIRALKRAAGPGKSPLSPR